MKIKAIKMCNNTFETPGTAHVAQDGYLIDTGFEVILVDTGQRASHTGSTPQPNPHAHTRECNQNYLRALHALGYRPEQVTRIIVTHNQPYHTAALNCFPQAKIYISAQEAATLNLCGNNIVIADCPQRYHDFARAQKITDGIYYVEDERHDSPHDIVIIEDHGHHYMIHSDLTTYNPMSADGRQHTSRH